MSNEETSTPSRTRRERSTRYPGVALPDCVEMCKFIESKGLDGLPAGDIATSLGYKNIKTNTFSARLSASRQFGLLILRDEGYSLTPLAKSILHPIDPAEMGRYYKQAFREPPIYAELIERLDGKRVPDVEILANILYHNHQITVAAKESAAEAFLATAKFAGAMGDDLILRMGSGSPVSAATPTPSTSISTPARVEPLPLERREPSTSTTAASPVRIDLRLWGEDEGKVIRVRAPESVTQESFDRLIQALKLHLRIE